MPGSGSTTRRAYYISGPSSWSLARIGSDTQSRGCSQNENNNSADNKQGGPGYVCRFISEGVSVERYRYTRLRTTASIHASSANVRTVYLSRKARLTRLRYGTVRYGTVPHLRHATVSTFRSVEATDSCLNKDTIGKPETKTRIAPSLDEGISPGCLSRLSFFTT